jgi:hypothetical protein
LWIDPIHMFKEDTMISPVLRTCAALSLLAVLTGCYVLPVSPDGTPWPYPYGQAPIPVTPLPPAAGQPGMQMLPARLYPQNEKASQVGMLSGTIASFTSGKGRFTLNYRGEALTGEATRLDGDARRGVAAAYGPSGTYLSCEYQMRSPRTGAGTCTVSDGARYQVHVGE